jgi:ribokinase
MSAKNSRGAGFDVVVCGSMHLDIIVQAPALPKPDETAVGSAWAKVCGGKGGNQAVQAARAGAKTAMIGRIGDDDFGRTLLANLTHAQVDVSAVTVDHQRGSGMSVAIIQADGDYGAVIVSGANLGLEASAMPAIFAALGGAKVLVLQNEVPHGVNVAAAQVARKAGAQVILNAAPARPGMQDLLPLVDILIVNRVEAADMVGHPVTEHQSAIAALPGLVAETRAVIITLGGGGLVIGRFGHHPVFIAALPVEVASTHGAGDCFVGVLAAETASGRDLLSACDAANRAAAHHVSLKASPRKEG